MYDERIKGSYSETFIKLIDDVEFTKVCTTVIDDHKNVTKYQVNYNPPIPFNKEKDDWEKVDLAQI